MGYVDVVSEIGSLSIRARTLCGWGPRLKGLLGTSPDAEAVILVPCKSVHTYGMTYPIDVAFLGSSGEVLAYYKKVIEKTRSLRRECSSWCNGRGSL